MFDRTFYDKCVSFAGPIHHYEALFVYRATHLLRGRFRLYVPI